MHKATYWLLPLLFLFFLACKQKPQPPAEAGGIILGDSLKKKDSAGILYYVADSATTIFDLKKWQSTSFGEPHIAKTYARRHHLLQWDARAELRNILTENGMQTVQEEIKRWNRDVIDTEAIEPHHRYHGRLHPEKSDFLPFGEGEGAPAAFGKGIGGFDPDTNSCPLDTLKVLTLKFTQPNFDLYDVGIYNGYRECAYKMHDSSWVIRDTIKMLEQIHISQHLQHGYELDSIVRELRLYLPAKWRDSL